MMLKLQFLPELEFAPSVLSACNKFQMSGIDAVCHMAKVICRHSLRWFPFQYMMGEDIASANSKLSITTRGKKAFEEPARAREFYLAQQSHFDGCATNVDGRIAASQMPSVIVHSAPVPCIDDSFATGDRADPCAFGWPQVDGGVSVAEIVMLPIVPAQVVCRAPSASVRPFLATINRTSLGRLNLHREPTFSVSWSRALARRGSSHYTRSRP